MVIFDVNVVSSILQGYSTLPGYGKETLRPITIWKGNSFTTISARDPQISGKDSGKGDSDFNDSDSDISGDVHKKESPPTNSKYIGVYSSHLFQTNTIIMFHSDNPKCPIHEQLNYW